MRYLIIVEKTITGFSAYSPDLAGCAAAGQSESEVEQLMREAIEFHIEGMQLEGMPIPLPRTYATFSTAVVAA